MAIEFEIQDSNSLEFDFSDPQNLEFGTRDIIEVRQSGDYPDLTNKPQINGVILVGNKTTEELLIDVGVTSWNGQTGDVVYTPPEVPVQSVNGQTGDVVLNASDVGALPTNTPIPSKTSDLQNDSGYITGITSGDVTSALGFTPYNATNPDGYVNATQAKNAAPVQSVNGKTGSVSLSATDVNALPDNTPIHNVPSGGTSGQVLTKSSNSDYALEWSTPSGSVSSVNGQTGAVVLDAEDVGALPDDTTYVSSVNGQTGAVTIDDNSFIATYGTTTYAEVLAAYNAGKTLFAERDGAIYVLGSYSSGSSNFFNFYSTRFTQADRISIDSSRGWQAGGFTLVTTDRTINGKNLGNNITLNASDVGALPDNTAIPSKTSDLANDSNFITAAQAPVQSVNGETGTVVLDATDVGALPSNTNYALGASAGGNAVTTNGILYGKVDSTSTSTVFTAQISGVTSYYDGLTVMLRNKVVTSTTNFTININGLGAKPVYNSMATGATPTRDTTIFNANYTMLFVYSETLVSGGAWICYRGYNSDNNTIGYQLRTNSTVMTVTDTARYYKLYFTSADNEHWVPASVNSTNNATAARPVNQRPINPFGRIVYTSASTNYPAGGNLAATTMWTQYALVLGYSFNRTGAALNLTVKKPVYVKCAPQADGSAIMDADIPIVQDLPTTEDGKIYIYLGVAYDATHIELFEQHPVYYFKSGAIRLWTNADDEFIVSATVNVGTHSISCDKTPTETINAIRSGKDVRMNVTIQAGHTFYGIRPRLGTSRVEFILGENNDNGLTSLFIYADVGIDLWHYGDTVFIDLEYALGFMPDDFPTCKTLKFNHTDALPYWDTIEQRYDLGSLIEQLVLAACAASSSGKVTFGTNISLMGEAGWDMARHIYSNMGYGQGSIIYTTDDNGHNHAFRVVSADRDVVDNEYDAYTIACSGRAYHDYSSNKTYDITIEFGVKRIELGNDEYDYEAYAAVTAEEINITFV